jgi:hypothetical protein
MIQLPKMPASIAALPRDDRGYPVPWFVAWIDDKPEFRCADPAKWRAAVKEHRCWVCGEKLGQGLAFVIGPMCAVNRTTAEPPCHMDCAEFSVKACPFLSKPKAHRREAGLPEDTNAPPGFAIRRNPGVTLIWLTRDYQLWNPGNGPLFEIGDPVKTWWYCEGRKATREEVLESINTGLPLLESKCESVGDRAALARYVERVMRYLPKERVAI